MMRVVMLAMGGPISTQVLDALIKHSKVDLLSVIKPNVNSHHSLSKKIMLALPKSVQSTLRKRRIETKGIESWQFPDLIDYHNVPEKYISDINGKEAEDYLTLIRPDFIVIANYNQILKSNIIAIPKNGIINFHPSLLPQYRGANPIFWMFKNNEKVGGITLHKVDEGIDTGSIIDQRQFELSNDESIVSYTQKCAGVAHQQVTDFFDHFNGQIGVKKVEDEVKSPYFKKPKAADGELKQIDELDLVFRNYNVMRRSVDVFIRIDKGEFLIDSVKLVGHSLEPSEANNKVVLSSNGMSLIIKGKLNG